MTRNNYPHYAAPLSIIAGLLIIIGLMLHANGCTPKAAKTEIVQTK